MKNKIQRHILIVLVFIVSAQVSALFAAIGWESAQLLSSPNGFHRYPAIAVRGSVVAVCWYENTGSSGNIWFTISRDNGKTWSSGNTIAHITESKKSLPSIILTTNNEALVVWSGDNETIYCYAESWSNPVLVTSNEGIATLPKIFYSEYEKKYYLFYHKQTDSGFQLCVTGSSDGRRWDAIHIVLGAQSSGVKGSFFPAVVFNKKKIILLWEDRIAPEDDPKDRRDSIFCKTSADGGKSWSSPIRITSEEINAVQPSVLLFDKKLHLVYITDTAYGVSMPVYRISDDNGASWSEETVVLTNHFGSCYYPGIGIDNNNIIRILYYNRREGNAELYYASRAADDVTSFSEPKRITTSSADSWKPVICSGGNRIHLVYEERSSKNSRIFYRVNDHNAPKPIVRSITHAESLPIWNTKAQFQWKVPNDPSGIEALAYTLDSYSNTEPFIENALPQQQSVAFQDLEDGDYYFHIRTKDTFGNWSDTEHYHIIVDTSYLKPPVIASPTHTEYEPSTDRYIQVVATTPDKRQTKIQYGWSESSEKEPSRLYQTDASNFEQTLTRGENVLWSRTIDKQGHTSSWVKKVYAYWSTDSSVKLAEPIYKDVTNTVFSRRLSYGETISEIITEVLELQYPWEFKLYLKSVAFYNDIENFDAVKPGYPIFFPCIIAKETKSLSEYAVDIFGQEQYVHYLVVKNKSNEEVHAGDTILVRDVGYLRTGDLNELFTRHHKQRIAHK